MLAFLILALFLYFLFAYEQVAGRLALACGSLRFFVFVSIEKVRCKDNEKDNTIALFYNFSCFSLPYFT